MLHVHMLRLVAARQALIEKMDERGRPAPHTDKAPLKRQLDLDHDPIRLSRQPACDTRFLCVFALLLLQLKDPGVTAPLVAGVKAADKHRAVAVPPPIGAEPAEALGALLRADVERLPREGTARVREKRKRVVGEEAGAIVTDCEGEGERRRSAAKALGVEAQVTPSGVVLSASPRKRTATTEAPEASLRAAGRPTKPATDRSEGVTPD